MAHGDVMPSDRAELDSADTIIAANGGSVALDRWGVLPHLLVGDLDSVGRDRVTEYGRKGVTVVEHPAEKDESDLELALRVALERGAEDIVLLGIFGGPRLDHALANTILLADPAYRGRGVRSVYGPTTVRALHGGDHLTLRAPVGALVTLLPVRDDAEGVSTEGLRYRLSGDTLRFGRSRGLSNVVSKVPASVRLERGVLLVIETRGGGG